MSTFDGFELDRVAALAKAVGTLETSATTISTTIATTDYQADFYLNLGYGVPPQVTRANPYTSDSTSPDRAGLRAVALAAPGVAAEIKRRLAHLTACQKIVADGYPIDADVVFDDEPPPDEQKIKDALSKLPGCLDNFTSGVADDDLVNTLSGLNAAEVDAVISGLSDADLQKLGMAVSLKDTPNIAGVPYGMSDAQRVKLANALLPKLGQQQLIRLGRFVELQPSTDVDMDEPDLTWQTLTSSLYGTSGRASIEDINQGNAGDCWFLAAVGAELNKNPNFVNQHITANANGTYTVTFYQDGKAVPVTVSNSVPVKPDGTVPFTHSTSGWNTDGPAWIAIYEKAYAQLKGGYGAIEGGWGSDGMTSLTGTSSDKSSPGDISISDMQSKWKDGHPITVGTKDHTTGHLFWKTEHEYFDVDGQTLVSSHEYTVVGFGTPTDHPGQVKLRNPWGNSGNAEEYVWVSQDELKDNFGEVSVGND